MIRAHVCGQGETLHFLAKKYNIDVNLLLSYNQHIQDPTSIIEGAQVTIPSIMGLDGLWDGSDNKGNVCAYVSDEPVHYNKPNIPHWPSEDYLVKHGHQAEQQLPKMRNEEQQYRSVADQPQAIMYPQYQYPNQVGYYYPYYWYQGQ
ncbi:LysM peptidoglycan-binding domain-containing protein [Bacillus sp. FJAT-45350]|uniref:LysM peptidoglycan-binding domain-containing protein n=1 Tax=Bacillus sp. FJAT-45350 TaxID=2011014 RepID=UPI000BB8B293|nr:LysM domain-containing protein [Bacillus sp. FJAT-45350]